MTLGHSLIANRDKGLSVWWITSHWSFSYLELRQCVLKGGGEGGGNMALGQHGNIHLKRQWYKFPETPFYFTHSIYQLNFRLHKTMCRCWVCIVSWVLCDPVGTITPRCLRWRSEGRRRSCGKSSLSQWRWVRTSGRRPCSYHLYSKMGRSRDSYHDNWR